MKKHFSIITFWLVAVLIHAGFSTASTQQILEKIEFNSSDQGVDLIIFKLNGAYLPNTFALKGDRPRVIFDFLDIVPTKAVKNTIPTDGHFIKNIRTGIHKGDKPKTRVVLDLKSDKAIDFKQNFDSETNTLVISIFAAGTSLPPSLAAKSTEPEPAAAPQTGATPEHEQPSPPEEAVQAAVQHETEVTPEPEASLPAINEKQDEQLLASIPQPEPATGKGPLHDESTIIQPLSEIGDQEAALNGSKPPTLYSIEFDKNSNRGEMIIFKLNNFNPPVVFGIEEDIPRIVCFFKDTSAGEELRDLIESNGHFVKNIRVGKYRNPDNIRVVLDLVPNQNYDLQQVFFKEDNMFMIIINTSGEKSPSQSS